MLILFMISMIAFDYNLTYSRLVQFLQANAFTSTSLPLKLLTAKKNSNKL